jgi:hypothetical protein
VFKKMLDRAFDRVIDNTAKKANAPKIGSRSPMNQALIEQQAQLKQSLQQLRKDAASTPSKDHPSKNTTRRG